MQKKIIVNGDSFPIQPQHIHIGEGFQKFWNAFDHSETETSAFYIVSLCQKLGNWGPFTKEQIEEHYRSFGHQGFTFNRLVEYGHRLTNASAHFAGDLPQTEQVGGGWIVIGADDKYYVTDDFVTCCFRSSPVTRAPYATVA